MHILTYLVSILINEPTSKQSLVRWVYHYGKFDTTDVYVFLEFWKRKEQMNRGNLLK